jgi:hypothetical protein
MNTAGAVVGALITAFALLPELGLTHTIWFAAGSMASCSCSRRHSAAIRRLPHRRIQDAPTLPLRQLRRQSGARATAGPCPLI